MPSDATLNRRVRVRVEGVVQGVGFRPYVHRLAREIGLGGFVRNDERGVIVEVESTPAAVERFLQRLPAEAPALASVERVRHEEMAPNGDDAFTIVESTGTGQTATMVGPDAATCADCRTELFDPADRRYRYPFTNCTNCGPRFTIVRGIPYDRARTTMSGFAMCPLCLAEYRDPTDRRFHAEANACPQCGPTAWIADRTGARVEPTAGCDVVGHAAAALRDGMIVAVKGIGGFHLACRSDVENVVARLRARKHREEKPFALMAPDLRTAGELVQISPAEQALLSGRERPIVLARRRTDGPVAPSVAPGSSDLGVMLPYTPLHELLLADFGASLVMTSGNLTDEPIAYRDADALERLAAVADLYLLHDRPIQTRTDDSVLRALDQRRPLMLRRSRGYIPSALPIPTDRHPPVLACGAELKSTFCLAKDGRAWVGHHIGDLQNYETLSSFREGIDHFERLLGVVPEVVAHDLHPDYLSTGYALDRDGVRHVAVQHHHAHLAAVLAEHGHVGPAVGAIFDGTGYGPDGTVWGGEILAGDPPGFQRLGHLTAVRMPGGEAAIREPWRMACAWMVESIGDEPPLPAALTGLVDAGKWRSVARIARSGLASPLTTSMGRLFDAVSALVGLRAQVSYEGQAAVMLEACVDPAERGELPMAVTEDEDGLVLDARETISCVLAEVAAGTSAGVVAARFHNGVSAATARACQASAERLGLDTVVLSGGVFQNRVLLEGTAQRLVDAGLRVLVPERLPPNDGAISYGQAAIAAAS